MKPAHIAVLVVRLVAFYIAVLAAINVTNLGMLVNRFPDIEDVKTRWLLGNGITILLQCALAWIVYACAPRIAGVIAGEPSSAPIGDRLAAGELALRVAGILILDQASKYVALIVEVRGSPDTSVAGSSLLYPAVSLLVLAGLGALLYWKAGPLARRLFATATEPDVAASTLAQAVAFSVLGVWFVVGALPEFLERLIALSSEDGHYWGLAVRDDAVGLILVALRFTFGLVLFMSAAVIASAWRTLRTAGLPRANEPKPSPAVEAEP